MVLSPLATWALMLGVLLLSVALAVLVGRSLSRSEVDGRARPFRVEGEVRIEETETGARVVIFDRDGVEVVGTFGGVEDARLWATGWAAGVQYVFRSIGVGVEEPS